MNNNVMQSTRLKDGCPVLIFDIPKPIQKELDVWVKESKHFKNHPLAELKAHENVGYKMPDLSWGGDGLAHNTYQTSISPRLIEESFWLAWVCRLSSKYWGMGLGHRQFSIRKWNGHFDSYDMWTNFSYKGDDNPPHNHAGYLSGVIYYKNHGHPTIFDEYGCAYEGKDGTMVMFPSKVMHHVEEQSVNKERITLAFNVIRSKLLPPGM